MSKVYSVDFNKVRKNVDLYQVFRVTSDGTAPTDITGFVFKMEVEPALGGAPVLTLTVGNGITIIDALDGRFAIDVDSSRLASVPAGSYKHDLVVDRFGASSTLWEGKMKIKDGVTDL